MQCVKKYSLFSFRLLRQIDERNLKSKLKSKLKFVLIIKQSVKITEFYSLLSLLVTFTKHFVKPTSYYNTMHTYIDFTKYFFHSTSVEK